LAGWVDRFAAAHGALRVAPHSTNLLCLQAADGSTAQLVLRASDPGVGDVDLPEWLPRLTAARGVERLGLIVIRRGGYSVGVASGATVIAHRTGSRYVQGRTAAGGWSQQRYARRRGNQATAAFAAAADAVARIVLPHADTLHRVVAGGERQAVHTVLADARLAAVAARLQPAMYSVGEPKRASLDELLAKARAVTIEVAAVD
jgi:peptide subunit release factor 1 (eRF1)